MFKDNKYTKLYFKLCNQNKDIGEKFETHHIIPRSLGGTNEAQNLTKLTYREHYIAHLILTKCVIEQYKNKMIYALFRMSNSNNFKQIKGYSKKYNNNRELFKLSAGSHLKGKTYEQIHGLEIAKKLKKLRSEEKSFQRKGKSWDDIFGQDTSKKLKKQRSLFFKNLNTGKKHSDESKNKIREKALNRTYAKVECDICSKPIGINNIKSHKRTH